MSGEMDQIEVEIPMAEARKIQDFINRNLTEIAEEIEEFLEADAAVNEYPLNMAYAEVRAETVEALRQRVAVIRSKHG